MARAITYLVVALLAFAALRVTPPIERKPAEVLAVSSQRTELGEKESVKRTIDTLGIGETLSGVLTKGGLSGNDAAAAVRSASSSLDERRVPAGLQVTIDQQPGDSLPTAITLRFAVDHLLHLQRTATGWTSREERLPWTTDTVVVAGTIRSNLYGALDSAADGVLPKEARSELAWSLADIMEYRVDMSRDLQNGDSFRALFERQTGPENVVRVGKVLAMTFVLSRDTTRAFRFGGEYFDAAGKSLRNAFLRAPLEFRRISSVFGMREHPILGGWRQHKGTDYAAAAGTPVRAIGDGVVVFAGQAHGYGNLLELRHRNGFVTRYGHLRAFARGIHAGTHVTIGETVAYVGMTGLATGPHLHFEVLVNGVQRDPRVALKTTGGDPIPVADRPAFAAAQASLVTALLTPPGTPVRLASQ